MTYPRKLFMEEEELQSQTIEYLRFPLILLVIYIHSFGESLTENPNFSMAVYDNIRIFFSHILSRVAVPSFFVISGYLFFYKVKNFDGQLYRKKLRSRIRTIVVPYILWNTLFILQTVGILFVKILIKHTDVDIFGYFREHGWLNMLWACNVWRFRTSWFGWDIPTSGPILLVLWYMRDLMVCFLLTYFIWVLIKKMGRLFLCLLFICFVSGLWPDIPGLEVYSLFFFVFGAFMAINGKNLVISFSSHSKSILVVTVVLTVLMIYFKSDFTLTGQYIYPFYEVFGTMSVFILAGYLVQSGGRFSRIPHILSESSFFVYAIHTMLILSYTIKLMHKLLPGTNSVVMIANYLLSPILCAIIAITIYSLMSRFTPRTLGLLTGNRSRGTSFKR